MLSVIEVVEGVSISSLADLSRPHGWVRRRRLSFAFQTMPSLTNLLAKLLQNREAI
jgi:hypothetical protein